MSLTQKQFVYMIVQSVPYLCHLNYNDDHESSLYIIVAEN